MLNENSLITGLFLREKDRKKAGFLIKEDLLSIVVPGLSEGDDLKEFEVLLFSHPDKKILFSDPISKSLPGDWFP
ncbi:MAG: hypothetical protein JXA44_09065 [Methanospirillaceae archaeon]|nr:hypothetical protein [Methanospirillaceae archaeon]